MAEPADPQDDSQYHFYDAALTPGPFGMQNVTGAMCWWNAMLQTLFRTPGLNDWMLENKTELMRNRLAAAYITAFEFAMSQKNKQTNDSKINMVGHAVLSAFIKETIRKDKRYQLQGQQAPGWGLTDFLESLEDDNVLNLFNHKYECIIYCEKCKTNVSSRSDISPWHDMYCVKGMKTQTEYEQHIRYHISVVDDYRCEKCNTLMKKNVRLEKLLMLREIIILVFDKSTQARWFPERLAFKSTSNRMLRYKLYSQIEHVGNYNTTSHSSSGHYYAKVLCGDRWYLFNDEKVCPTSCTPSAETHMVFYHLEAHSDYTPEEIAAANEQKTKRAAMQNASAP